MSNDSNPADAATIEAAAVQMAGDAAKPTPPESENPPPADGETPATPAEGEVPPQTDKSARRRRIVRKILKWVGIVFGVLFVLLLLAILFRDPILKAAVPKYLTYLFDAKVEVADIDSSLFKGTLRVKGFKIANPDGFSQEEKAVELQELYVKLKLGSLFTKKIVVENINIKGLAVNVESYDAGFKRSNFSAIAENVKRKSKPKKKKPKEEKAPTQVVVRLLRIEDSSVSLRLLTDKDSITHKTLSIKSMPTVVIPLSIEKKDLGEDEKKGGTSWKSFKGDCMDMLTSAGEKFSKAGKKLKKLVGF